MNPSTLKPAELPDDAASLKAMLLSLVATHEQEKQRANQQQNRADNLQKKSDDLYIENLRLQVQVDRFKRWYYGPRADRLSTVLELGQMLLAFGEEFDSKPVNKEDFPADEKPDESPRRIRKPRGRRNLENFGKLPVQEHVYELSEAERACPCCGKERKEIGADESWQLEYYPGHFERLHHVRKKYACVGCEAEGENPRIESAVKPAAAIDKGLPGPGLLSYITVCKFDMYLPLYRLENHFDRQGFRIARSTQSIWCGDVADLVEPVYRRMIKRVLQSHLIPKHPMADAVNYALNQWQTMTIFLADASVPLDNNLSEREMKRVVINRKNSLFVGNERGGRNMAILSSFTSTCRRLGIDSQLYLTQLITNLPVLKQDELDLWLPDVWKLRLESSAGPDYPPVLR